MFTTMFEGRSNVREGISETFYLPCFFTLLYAAGKLKSKE